MTGRVIRHSFGFAGGLLQAVATTYDNAFDGRAPSFSGMRAADLAVGTTTCKSVK